MNKIPENIDNMSPRVAFDSGSKGKQTYPENIDNMSSRVAYHAGSLKSGTIKKSLSFVSKFLPLLGVAGGAGGAAGAGAAGAGAAGATAGQAAGAALNVASNLAESKTGKRDKALLHTSIAPAMRHAKRIAAHDRMLENFNPRRFDKPATVAKVGKGK
jgi:hypothetical protein